MPAKKTLSAQDLVDGTNGQEIVLSSPLPLAKVKKIAKQKNLLKDALADLEEELQELLESKRKLDLQLLSLTKELRQAQNKEIKLQEQISSVKQKQTLFSEKKIATKEKMDLIEKKIEKVKSIEQELKEV